MAMVKRGKSLRTMPNDEQWRKILAEALIAFGIIRPDFTGPMAVTFHFNEGSLSTIEWPKQYEKVTKKFSVSHNRERIGVNGLKAENKSPHGRPL